MILCRSILSWHVIQVIFLIFRYICFFAEWFQCVIITWHVINSKWSYDDWGIIFAILNCWTGIWVCVIIQLGWIVCWLSQNIYIRAYSVIFTISPLKNLAMLIVISCLRFSINWSPLLFDILCCTEKQSIWEAEVYLIIIVSTSFFLNWWWLIIITSSSWSIPQNIFTFLFACISFLWITCTYFFTYWSFYQISPTIKVVLKRKLIRGWKLRLRQG